MDWKPKKAVQAKVRDFQIKRHNDQKDPLCWFTNGDLCLTMGRTSGKLLLQAFYFKASFTPINGLDDTIPQWILPSVFAAMSTHFMSYLSCPVLSSPPVTYTVVQIVHTHIQYIHTYIQYTHVYIHTYIHTYIHAHTIASVVHDCIFLCQNRALFPKISIFILKLLPYVGFHPVCSIFNKICICRSTVQRLSGQNFVDCPHSPTRQQLIAALLLSMWEYFKRVKSIF